ncbi:MAG: alginate export family protein [Bacteroidales bacterium]|nr:alginate export family protein [Bacteroidales bacterium]
MKKLLVNCVLIFLAYTSYAQFEINGELRPRFEMCNGYKELRNENSEAAMFITQRSRIGLNYKNDLYKTHISFQDVRIWGQEEIKKNQLNIGLHEAWVEINLFDGLKIITGRQGIQYDNGRLMTKSNWNQIGLKHDAIRLTYKTKGFEAELTGAYNQSLASNFESSYALFNKQYQGLAVLWVKKTFKKFSLATLNIAEGLRESDTTSYNNLRITSGLIAEAKLSSFSVQARGFYQMGKKQNGTKVSAYYANADVNYKLNGHLKFITGMEYLSGNDMNNPTETDHAFDILYGSKHKFNGFMDFFNSPKTTKGLGLVNPYFKANAKVNKILSLGIDYHTFLTATKPKFDDVEYSTLLGHEFDLSAKFTINKEINILAVYGYFMANETMEKMNEVFEAKPGHYFMTMLTFKPVFFKN